MKAMRAYPKSLAQVGFLREVSKRALAASLATLLAGCNALDQPKYASQQNNESNVPAANLNGTLKPIDPEKAKVTLNGTPALAAASEGSTLKVPQVNFNLVEADYVQVLRCAKGTLLRTRLGDDVAKIPETHPTRLQQLKGAWVDAVQDYASCKVIGTKIARNSFLDYAAKSGEFFYVINPCVLRERSTKQNEECSYNLVTTTPLRFENTLTQEFTAAAEKLALAESTFAGHYSQLYYFAQTIQLHQQNCERNAAVKQAAANFFKGLASFVIAGVGAAVGAIATGGAGALMGFKTGMGIASALFGNSTGQPPLQCPVVDEYINRAQDSYAKVEEAAKAVLDARVEMSKLDDEYAKLDQAILDNLIPK